MIEGLKAMGEDSTVQGSSPEEEFVAQSTTSEEVLVPQGVASEIGDFEGDMQGGVSVTEVNLPQEEEEGVETEEEEASYVGQARDIILLGDPTLREVSKHVPVVNEAVRNLISDMAATLRDYGGAGLAAPQIGQLWRVVMHVEWQEDEHLNRIPRVRSMINPKVVERGGRYPMLEGCLSVPGARGTVTRYRWVVIEYADPNGEMQTVRFTDALAATVQHELDHLDGTLFIDHLSKFQKSRAMQQHRKVMKQAYRQARRQFS